MIKELAKSIRQYKKPSILTPLFVALEVVMECIIPFITAMLVEEIQSGCEFMTIVYYGLVLICMAGMSLLFGILSGLSCATASCGFAKNLRHDMFEKIQGFSFENIDKFLTSSLVTRMTTDVMYVQMSFMMIIRIAIRAPLMFIFSIVMAAVMGGIAAAVYAVVVPILLVGLIIIIKKALPIYRRVFKKYDTLNNSVQENVKGMRVVKSFVREDFEKQKFNNAALDINKDFTRAERLLALNGPVMQFCLYAVMVLVLTVGSYLIITSKGADMNVGQISAMVVYGFMILSSLMMLSMIFAMITMSAESAKRIVEVLKEESAIVAPENAVTEITDGSIDFDGVRFKYSKQADRFALDDIDLHIKSGETIGIVGGTGSSKTTLIQLICRLYDVTEGTVKVGGRDVREYDLEALRNNVAVVLQKNILFSGTIKENLRWGNPDATDEQMRQACVMAAADEFIQTFPDGYDTFIEQGGANVSGGQKQRLCIARALLKNPKILILDDSTSAVDTRTDKLIRDGLKKYAPDTTKIIIAQRTGSVEDADRIIVMDGGRINAVGTNNELIKSNAIYREIYTSQNKAGTDEI